MALPLSTLTAWLERQREKLIDAALLAFALNYAGLFSATPPPSLGAQLTILAAFAALAAPRTHEMPGLWRRYLKLLPGYLLTAIAGTVLLVWWFNLPRSHGWFVPVWLATTAVARLPLVAFGQYLRRSLASQRLEIVALDLLLLGSAAWAVPLWAGRPDGLLVSAGLPGLAWVGLNLLTRWHDPIRSPRSSIWTAPLLAVVWALAWRTVAGGGVDRLALVFGTWLAVLLVTARLACRRWTAASTDTGEVWRWLGLLAAGCALLHPFARSGLHGSGDALYYATFLADAVEQFRQGVFPVFVGQSEFQFNGSVMPIRIAPGFQYVGGLADLLTGHTLGPLGIQNLVIALTGVTGLFSAYACLLRAGARPNQAWLLGVLYLTCPGAAGLAFNSDLYMSWLTFPLVPPVLLCGALTFRRSGWRLYGALGFVLGLTWWLHTPIALWLTVLASILQATRLLTRRPAGPVLGRELAAGALGFLLVAAYPLVSAVLYPADPSLGSSVALTKQEGVAFIHPSRFVLEQLQATFPAAWQPMSRHARVLTDYQLGYGLLLVGLLAGLAAWRTRQPELRVMTATGLWLLLLLVPVPWLTLHLWQWVPAPVITVTNVWVMQRFYLLLAGLIVFLAAIAWNLSPPSRGIQFALLAACGWSCLEAAKFVHGSAATTTAASYAAHSLLPENITLTRYSYGLFARKPAYFTHGVTDPILENRLLAADLRTVVAGNPGMAAQQAEASRASARTFFAAGGRLVTREPFVLQPGQHYLAEVTSTVSPFPAATLVVAGETLRRVYGLPEYGESRSFGLGRESPPFFPLRTTSLKPETVNLQFVPANLAQLAALDSRLRVRLAEYDPATLPVQVLSWIPYTAAVQSPGALWLETPRMHQPGYVATVNGRPAEVRRSAEGLASVAVPAGHSEVVLRYVAPAGLAAAFWISLAALATGTATGLLAAGRALKAGVANPATPATPGR